MSTTAKPAPVEAPDAGVIADARARQHRRRGIVAIATTIAALAFVLGVALSRSGSTRPSGRAVRAAAPCTADQLSATLFGEGATETLLGAVTVTNDASAACRLGGRATISMRGGSPHERLEQGAMNTGALFPGEHFGRTVLLRPGQSASARFQWGNWCNPAVHAAPTTAAAGGRRP